MKTDEIVNEFIRGSDYEFAVADFTSEPIRARLIELVKHVRIETIKDAANIADSFADYYLHFKKIDSMCVAVAIRATIESEQYREL